jgi:hypothetical protein
VSADSAVVPAIHSRPKHHSSSCHLLALDKCLFANRKAHLLIFAQL